MITVLSEDAKKFDRQERSVHDFAVELCIAESNQVDEIKNERTEFIQRMESIRSTSKIELSDLLGEERITYVRGAAGSGKTVLCKKLATKWANNEIYTNFPYALLIESRDLCSPELTLEDFMKERSFPDPEQLNAKDILFIIDGLDEVENLYGVVQARNSTSILSKLLTSQVFRESKFILTGRPHVEKILKDAVEFIGNMKVYEICGLSEKSIDTFINMFAKQDPEKIEKIKKARETTDSIKSTLQIPLYLNSFCCIALMTGGLAIRNVTELYIWLLYILLAEHFNKKNKKDVEPAVLFRSFSSLIVKLGEISFSLLQKKKIIFTQKEFQSTLHDIEENKEIADAFKSFCSVRSEGYQLEKRFQFLHLTVQEFLASVFCYVNEIEPRELIENNNYEIPLFMSGFHGAKQESSDQQDTMVKIFVEHCLETKGVLSRMFTKIKKKVKQPFFIKLLKALEKDNKNDRIRLERALAFLCEYLDNHLKYDQRFIDLIFQKLIQIMPIDNYYGEGRVHWFSIHSSVAQSNLLKLIDIIKNHNLLHKLSDVYLTLRLVNFSLCKYFKHFRSVWVFVNSVESVDNLNLFFNHCKYCNDVVLNDCKLIGNLELDLLIRQLNEDDDNTRMEVLMIIDCEFHKISWMNMIQIIVNTKTVYLNSMKMEEEEWRSLVDVIEQRQRVMKLEVLKFWNCNISDQLVERVRRLFMLL